MKEKVLLSKEKLFSFKNNEGKYVDVFLSIYSGSEPLIETEPGALNRKVGNQIGLSSLFQPKPIDTGICQLVGDGPEMDCLPNDLVVKAANYATSIIGKNIGQLKVVWVPNDGFPF